MAIADMRWWQRLSTPVRRLRWSASRWSAGSDRAFHDRLFADQPYDPFSPSYPGHLTIRRFADHAERALDGVRTGLDLGCGPGEITCELARRRPDVRFTGLDHSEVALDRARGHARRLGLTNVTFASVDLERFIPAEPVDLILMFDAFHHVLDPAGFVARLRPHAARFFLIEPAGTWLGQWDRRGDLDWLPVAVRQIRERLEYQFGLDPAASPADGPEPGDTGPNDAEPTEHRYTRPDLERFFDGYALDVRGTMAGLEDYGARPGTESDLRSRFGDVTAALVAEVEDALFAQGLDLALKHWAITATRVDGAARPQTRPVTPPLLRQPPGRGPAAYGVEFLAYEGPSELRAGEAFQAEVRVKNTGWMPWNSRQEEAIMVSYHWLDAGGRTVVEDGLRTPFASVVEPGQMVTAVLRGVAPDRAGTMTLAIDLVHEGRAWFSDEGVVPRREPIRIRQM